jgi:fructoselysine/glucoselysine PTS system EIIA component
MRKFLIASHGSFAGGLLSSLELIAGKIDNIFTIEAYSDCSKSIEEQIEKVLFQIDKTDELIIFTDLMGGSVTNQILRSALRKNVYIISGVNLPLLLDIILADTGTPVAEVIETGITNSKNQIVFVNKLIPSND